MILEAFMIIQEVYMCAAKRNNQLAFRVFALEIGIVSKQFQFAAQEVFYIYI